MAGGPGRMRPRGVAATSVSDNSAVAAAGDVRAAVRMVEGRKIFSDADVNVIKSGPGGGTRRATCDAAKAVGGRAVARLGHIERGGTDASGELRRGTPGPAVSGVGTAPYVTT
jgi:hypothetical protein